MGGAVPGLDAGQAFAGTHQPLALDKFFQRSKPAFIIGPLRVFTNFAAKGSPLYEIPNLFLTPKLGSFTLETRARASWYVAQRVHEALTTPHSGPESVPIGQMHLDAQVSALGPISGPASLDDR